LIDHAGVIDGDCGSLVVNKETLEIYGHVVATNPLGEAYVVPLQNTLDQIRVAFAAEELTLPAPEPIVQILVQSILSEQSHEPTATDEASTAVVRMTKNDNQKPTRSEQTTEKRKIARRQGVVHAKNSGWSAPNEKLVVNMHI
jgi:hypothetical protein